MSNAQKFSVSVAASALLTRFGDSVMVIAPEHLARFTDAAPSAAIEMRRRTFGTRLAHASAQPAFVPIGMFGCYWRRADGLAIVPVWGVVGPARAWCWTAYEDVTAAAEAIAKDGDVKAVLWHFDSPGGYVSGLQPAAAAIEACAKVKPSAAFADEVAASSAYWLACAAGRLTAPPNAVVASIGAMKTHEEISSALDQAGVAIEIIRSAPRKAEGNPFEPLSPAARAEMQTEVTAAADQFIGEVSRLRGVADVAVRATQGAGMSIADASAAKLADGVETFDQACAALMARAQPPAPAPIARPAPLAARKPAPKTTSTNPARGKTALTTPTSPRARAQTRSSTMDPTTLTPEDQIARYDEIAALIAQTPADDHAKIGQFVQIVTIVTREPAAPAADPEADPAADPAAPAAAKAAVALAIANSPEGKANPQGALAAISSGLTLAQFKALSPSLAKPGGLNARMAAQPGATPLGNDPKVTQTQVKALPTSAELMASRRKQVSG